MANWDKFVINNDKATIMPFNKPTEQKVYDVVQLSSGTYFFDKNVIFTNEAFEKLNGYSKKELEESSDYQIYIQVGHVRGDEKSGITCKLTDIKSLNQVIKELEEKLS